jgi:serine/threonine-protein kinase ATR
LDDARRCEAMEYIGYIPCGISGYLTIYRDAGKVKTVKCLICEGNNPQKLKCRDKERLEDMKNAALLALSRIIKFVDLLDNRRPRVLAMFTLRRFALHFDDPEFLNLEISPLAQWCMKSLTSSNRELRIAAG